MNIVLKRYRIKPDTIDGQIWIDGLKVCDCAENAHHCLPSGNYQVAVCKCAKHARKMPVILADESLRVQEFKSSNDTLEPLNQSKTIELLNCSACPKLPYVGNNTSMPCKCVQLCPGNGVYNRTDGAILVGKYLAPGCLSHPKSAFDALYERIRKNAERGNEISLTIINQPLQTSHL